MLAGGCALLTATACAQTWHFQASAGIRETLTDNVNLEPSDFAHSDLVSELIPGFTVNEKGARSDFSGSVRVPILFYVRTGAKNNKVLPEANLRGRIEAVENLFFVEGAASVQQTFFTPFGAQPVSLVNATSNRVRTESYRVTPYLKSPVKRELHYELRDDNIWTRLGSAPSGANDSYTNHLTGNITRDPTPVGWAVEIDRNEDKFVGQRPLITQLARGRLPVQIDPEVRVSATAGYEENRYTFNEPHGVIYGASAEWLPAPRTTLRAKWEHRFFGASYDFSFDDRTPRSTWNFKASRNLTSYPQQLASLPASGDVASTLNQLFLSRIPDPTERQTIVDQIINSAGLPTVLSGPITLFAQQVYLQQDARANVGILGARNHLLFTAYRTRIEPITGSGTPLPPELIAQNNNTQTGGNVVWDHTMTPTTTLSVNAAIARTVANAGLEGTTTQRSVIAEFISQLSPALTAHLGMRYQIFHSDLASSYHEAAIFAGLSYVCCSASSRAVTTRGSSAATAGSSPSSGAESGPPSGY